MFPNSLGPRRLLRLSILTGLLAYVLKTVLDTWIHHWIQNPRIGDGLSLLAALILALALQSLDEWRIMRNNMAILDGMVQAQQRFLAKLEKRFQPGTSVVLQPSKKGTTPPQQRAATRAAKSVSAARQGKRRRKKQKA